MPGRSTPRTRTIEALREAKSVLGLGTPRRCISSSRTDRCGDGAGSLPVPRNPMTRPTASTRTGNMPNGEATSPTRRPWVLHFFCRSLAASFSGLSMSCVIGFHTEQPPSPIKATPQASKN